MVRLTKPPQSDRWTMDEAVFSVLRLTAGERARVYEAVAVLVQARLEKALSI